MTCQERRDLMLLYAAGALEPAEAGEVRGHLGSGCPVCAGALAEAEATVHRIPESLEPVAVPGAAWEKIEDRISASTMIQDKYTPGNVSWRWRWFAQVAAAVLFFLIPMTGFYIAHLHGGLEQANSAIDDLHARLKEQEAIAVQAQQLQIRVADLERQITTLHDDNKKMLVMLDQAQLNYIGKITRLMHADQYAVTAAQDKGAKGTLFWNRGDGTWTLMASNLAPLPAGRTYELWIVTAKGEKLPAGTFDATPSETAMHEIKLPADVGAIQLAAVTDEPLGGAIKPTGQIQFLSDVTKKP